MAPSDNHLLVFGASGVSGWACVKEALEFPSPSTFQRITGLTNRPLAIEDSKLPNDGRLQLVSGIDLTGSVENVVSAMKSKIQGIDTVTHIIFTAYIEKPDFETLRTVNTNLLKTAISAVDQLAPNLQSVVLQTGGKAYGVEFSDKLEIKPPLKESQPRIPQPCEFLQTMAPNLEADANLRYFFQDYDKIFYYTQHDLLKELSAKRSWTYSEIRPDVIIGFTPGSNFMNCAQGLGLWLSLAREVYGTGAKIPFPGSKDSWKNKHTDTFQDILGRMDIFAVVNNDKCGNGGIFNVADGDVVTWEDKWDGEHSIPGAFGLVGTPPNEPYSIEEFVKQHADTWQKMVQKHGLKEGIMENFSWPFLYFVMTVFDFDRQYDLSNAQSVGFNEKIDTVKGFATAFQRMREAKIIP